MKLVVLGLSLSSSWGNGHATTFRALLKAFAGRGHDILFLERDVPWYREQRDLAHPDFCDLCFYADIDDLVRDAGFRPATPLKTGIGRFVDWYRTYHGI